jgi:hypothetical protein
VESSYSKAGVKSIAIWSNICLVEVMLSDCSEEGHLPPESPRFRTRLVPLESEVSAVSTRWRADLPSRSWTGDALHKAAWDHEPS